MKSRPREFFDTFRPFPNNKTKYANSIFLKMRMSLLKITSKLLRLLPNISLLFHLMLGAAMTSLSENEFSNHRGIQIIETVYNNSSFQIKNVNTKDVQVSFENLNPRKSCSDTGLMPKLMKKVAEGMVPSVTELYDRCIKASNWPATWKKGELTPIFKKGDKQNAENYRPITTLPIIDKVFESRFSKQITHHFDLFSKIDSI